MKEIRNNMKGIRNNMKEFRAYLDRYGDLIFEEKYSYRLWWKADNGRYMSTTGDVCTRDELFTTGCAIEYAGGKIIVTDDGLLEV